MARSGRIVPFAVCLLLAGAAGSAEAQATCAVAWNPLYLQPVGPAESYVPAWFLPANYVNCVETYRVYLPDAQKFPKPDHGWPVLIHLDLSNYDCTVDYSCLNPDAIPAADPDAHIALTQRRLGRILQSGIAVVTARATPSIEINSPLTDALWATLCPGVTNLNYRGHGMFHPPGAKLTGGTIEAYVDGRYPMPEKDAVMIIQHVRYHAGLDEGTGQTPNQAALNLLDPANVAVDGSSAGAMSLMWAALGPDRHGEQPFVGKGPQFAVDSRPKGAVLRGGTVWFPIFPPTSQPIHFGNDDTPAAGFGSDGEKVAGDLAHINVQELYKSSALWYSLAVSDIPVHMTYWQQSVCTDYEKADPSLACAPNCFDGQGMEIAGHPSWSGYAWKFAHWSTTRLFILSCEAFAQKGGVHDTIGLLPAGGALPVTLAQEDAVIEDIIWWLHALFAMPPDPDFVHQPWLSLSHIATTNQSGCIQVPVSVPPAGPSTPILTGTGTLEPGTDMTLTVTVASPEPATTCFISTGAELLYAPFRGGYLVPNPVSTLVVPQVSAGHWEFAAKWPADASGICVYYQAWLKAAGPPVTWSGSNGLMGTSP